MRKLNYKDYFTASKIKGIPYTTAVAIFIILLDVTEEETSVIIKALNKYEY